MYIITAIPITPLPRPNEQIFSYFFDKNLSRGTLAVAPLGNRSVKVLVLNSESLEKKKLDIRGASYKLKGLKKVFNDNRVLGDEDIELALWLSEKLFSPLGLVLKSFLPKYLLEKEDFSYEVSPTFTLKNNFSFRYVQGKSRFEKYRKIIQERLDKKEQILVLFPKTAEAKVFFNSLDDKIKKETLLYSSSFTPKKDIEMRKKILSKSINLIIGTRSSIFLSIPELSLIILEDEKDVSHKSWDQYPGYDTRSISLRIAKKRGLTLIWGSYTPSVKATSILKKEDRESLFEKTFPKKIEVVDMKKEIKEKNTSPLSRLIKDKVASLENSKKQALFLVNRRGRYTVVLCRDCGYVLKCSSCDSSLITIEEDDQKTDLFCRSCSKREEGVDLCPSCGSYKFKKIGAGTKRIIEEIKKLSFTASVAVLDSDSIKDRSQQQEVLKNFKEGKIKILVGTQMVARPELMPQVGVIGIINIESLLFLPNYNSEEDVYSVISSLQNICSDEIIWQTYNTEHRIVQFLQSGRYGNFLREELKQRQAFKWPPFWEVVKLNFVDKNKKRGEEGVSFVYSKLNQGLSQGVEVFEPFQSESSKVRGGFSWSIILKIDKNLSLEKRNQLLSLIPSKWRIEVDPVSIL